MNRYLVVSYDLDQQQWHYDIVFADDADLAQARILELREYCIDADVFTMEQLTKMTDCAQTMSRVESENWLRELEAESNV